jgi:hypothetical protein
MTSARLFILLAILLLATELSCGSTKGTRDAAEQRSRFVASGKCSDLGPGIRGPASLWHYFFSEDNRRYAQYVEVPGLGETDFPSITLHLKDDRGVWMVGTPDEYYASAVYHEGWVAFRCAGGQWRLSVEW